MAKERQQRVREGICRVQDTEGRRLRRVGQPVDESPRLSRDHEQRNLSAGNASRSRDSAVHPTTTKHAEGMMECRRMEYSKSD